MPNEPYLSTYLHELGNRKGLPISGTFELTARCNFRCPMCYIHNAQIDAARELRAAQWIDLAAQAKDAGMMFALLTGGEPFLRQDFFSIYRAMRDMGLVISINSNGSLLAGDTLRRLLDMPPNRINISLYGGCRETYRQMCGQDAFERVTQSIRALKEAGVSVQLNVSLTPANHRDLADIHRISQQIGVPMKASSYMFPSARQGQVGCCYRLSPQEAAQCAVQWDQLRFTREEFLQRAQSMHNLTLQEPKDCVADTETGIGCRAGRSAFWVTWEGKLLPCGMMPGPGADVLQTGFHNAWQQVRAQAADIRIPDKCAACPSRQVCTACAASCMAETGRFDAAPEYICRQTEEMARLTWQAYQECVKK